MKGVMVHFTLKAKSQKFQNRLLKLPNRLFGYGKNSITEIYHRITSKPINEQRFSNYFNSDVQLNLTSEKFKSRLIGSLLFDKEDKFFQTLLINTQTQSSKEHILLEAEQICNHIFNLLGSYSIYLGNSIDWHKDYINNHSWNPRIFYNRVRPANYPGGYDLKYPWELSRCQHFVRLGQAYWISQDEKYAKELRDEIESWIAANPWPFGVNWACTMDVAIRAVNWLWGLAYFANSPTLDDNFWMLVIASLGQHGRHILRNLEWSETLTTNHYLANLTGLIYLGILLPEFREASRWLEVGIKELELEMMKQVNEDGTAFEASTSYHRLDTELFLYPYLLSKTTGGMFSDRYLQRLEKMLEFIQAMTTTQGTVPQFGDADNGRLLRLKSWENPEREWNDFRYLLAIGAILLHRQDFARSAGDQWEEAIWLFGEQAVEVRNDVQNGSMPQRYASHIFSDSGLIALHTPTSDLLVDAGQNGQKGLGGHAHNDALSFELHFQETAWIIDPGTYVYSADYPARNRFRSTAYHNVVRVDKQEINPFREKVLWEMDADARVVIREVDQDPPFRVVAAHEGYLRLPDPVVHEREFQELQGSDGWKLIDRFSATSAHEYELFLHCGYNISLEETGEGEILLGSQSGARLRISWELDQNIEGFQITSSMGEISPGYGIKKPALVICAAWKASGPASIITSFSYHPAG